MKGIEFGSGDDLVWTSLRWLVVVLVELLFDDRLHLVLYDLILDEMLDLSRLYALVWN